MLISIRTPAAALVQFAVAVPLQAVGEGPEVGIAVGVTVGYIIDYISKQKIYLEMVGLTSAL